MPSLPRRRMPVAVALVLAIATGGCRRPERFPAVDLSKLRITLQRSACYGACPDYRVTIAGNGEVRFTTAPDPTDAVAAVHRRFAPGPGVLVGGTHRATIARAQVEALVQRFRDARFFALKDEYRAAVTDSATYVVSIDTGHGAKRVVDYVGSKAGMPPAVTAIEDAIDAAAGTRRWIEGTGGVIPLLEAEGARFDGELGARLMAAAAARDDVAAMARLAALGADLGAEAGAWALSAAAGSDRTTALAWLLARGAGRDPRRLRGPFESAVGAGSQKTFELLRPLLGRGAITPDRATRLLRSAAEHGNVAMTRYFLGLRPRLNASPADRFADHPPLFLAAQNDCAHESPTCDHREVVRMLLAAGADARWFDPIVHKNALFNVSDPQIARMLLQAGADPDLKDVDGEPIIFSVSDEGVALAMFDAGASLAAVRPADRMTLRSWAIYQRWPRVLARLGQAGL